MPRWFTVEDANAELPQLRERLRRIQSMRAAVLDSAEQISQRASRNGGAATPARAKDASDALKEEFAAIAAAGIILRDPQTGLVDFPAQIQGQEAFLCWRLGEDEVGFWHPVDSGFSGRRPL